MSDAVGRGTVLAGRYRVVQPVPSDLAGSSAWLATDQILDRPVRVRVLESGAVAPALDAARRAALVTDPRLVRVLDVGTHEGVGYVVTEQIDGSSLAQLVASGPLAPDQARAIVGEAASALEVARRRGVHHLALRPSIVHVGPDGRVLLTGLALDGALAFGAAGDARTTSRADTVGLVRLLYTALTGRWPADPRLDRLTGPDAVPEAPVMDGAPVAPADLVPGVPADLDTLCAVTLGPHDDGPHSPGELVRELEPWGDVQAPGAASAALTGTVAPPAPDPDVDHDSQDTAPVRVQRQSVRSAFGQAPTAGSRPGTPPPAAPARTSAFGSATVSPPVAPFTPPTVVVPPAASYDQAPYGDAAPTAAYAPSGPYPTPPAVPEDVPGPPTAVYGASAAAAASAAGRPASQPPAPGYTAPPPGAYGPPTQAYPPPPAPAPMHQSAPAAFAPSAGAPGAGSGPSGPVGPSGPFGPQESSPFDDYLETEPVPQRRRRFDPTALVLGIVAVAVLIGVIIAFKALFSSFDTKSSQGAAPDQSTPAQSAPASPAQTPQASEPAAPVGGPPVIAAATSIDPSDDDGEHEEDVPKAFDGDPGTFWYTQTYKRDDFAGFKDGVGYAMTLTAKTTVSTITLHTNSNGGHVEVRATDPSNPTGGAVLASGAFAPETVLTLDPATETQSIVLWITQLPTSGNGEFRLELNEISLS